MKLENAGIDRAMADSESGLQARAFAGARLVGLHRPGQTCFFGGAGQQKSRWRDDEATVRL